MLQIFERVEQCWVIHVILHRNAVSFGKLATIDIGRLKMRMRRQLERSVSPSVIAMGGVEFDADYRRRLWVPHFHLAVGNCTRAQLENLRDHYLPDGCWEGLLQIEDATNRPRQFVYTQKFWVARRHHQQTGPKRPPAFRLRLPEHNEYLRFLVRLSPTDLLFAMGVSRGNGQRFRISSRLNPDRSCQRRIDG